MPSPSVWVVVHERAVPGAGTANSSSLSVIFHWLRAPGGIASGAANAVIRHASSMRKSTGSASAIERSSMRRPAAVSSGCASTPARVKERPPASSAADSTRRSISPERVISPSPPGSRARSAPVVVRERRVSPIR
ncbi:MAG: hypothetical protein QM820_33865 [Minicystis sp.]